MRILSRALSTLNSRHVVHAEALRLSQMAVATYTLEGADVAEFKVSGTDRQYTIVMSRAEIEKAAEMFARMDRTCGECGRVDGHSIWCSKGKV